jgi:uncharacterized protein YlxW (UPF0749 family)
MSKESFFKDDNSPSMGLLSMLNNEIETNEYQVSEEVKQVKKDPKWWIAIVLSFAGLFFGVSIANAQRQQPIFEKNRENLRKSITKSIENLNITTQNLSLINNEIAQVRSLNPGLDFHGLNPNNETNLQIVSGLSAVQGFGYEIEINDAARTGSLDIDELNLARIYDSDVQLLVNALWATGAESISINNRRLTSTSAIRSAGEAIMVNYQPLLPPYKISAIGSRGIKEDINQNADFQDLQFVVKTYGLSFKMSEFKEIAMPATGVSLPDMQGITVGRRS